MASRVRVREHGVVVVCVAIALLQLVAALWHLDGWLRAPLTLLLVFVVPGMLGFKAARGHLPRTIVHAGIAVAASIGTAILVGILLSFVPHGFSSVGWSIAMAAIVIALAVVVTLTEPVGYAAPAPMKVRPPRVRTVLGLVVCVGLVAGGAAISQASQHTSVASSHFTELWLTQHTGKLPTVHVRNHEGGTARYRVVTTVGSSPSVSRSIALAPGASWATQVTGRATTSGATRSVQVQLYKLGTPGVYRHVSVTGAR